MSNGARPQQSGEDDSGALREALHGRGDFVARKFDVRRAHDIKPDYLGLILDDIGNWSQSTTGFERDDITMARSLENQIYAAISLYEEPKNRDEYFNKLRIIADQLKRL